MIWGINQSLEVLLMWRMNVRRFTPTSLSKNESFFGLSIHDLAHFYSLTQHAKHGNKATTQKQQIRKCNKATSNVKQKENPPNLTANQKHNSRIKTTNVKTQQRNQNHINSTQFTQKGKGRFSPLSAYSLGQSERRS